MIKEALKHISNLRTKEVVLECQIIGLQSWKFFGSLTTLYIYADSKYEDLSMKRNFSQKKRVIYIFSNFYVDFENVDHG